MPERGAYTDAVELPSLVIAISVLLTLAGGLFAAREQPLASARKSRLEALAQRSGSRQIIVGREGRA